MEPNKRLLLRNAAIVDAESAQPRPGMDVLIEGDAIREVSDRPIRADVASDRSSKVARSCRG